VCSCLATETLSIRSVAERSVWAGLSFLTLIVFSFFFCLCCCYVCMYEVVHLVATVAVTALQTVPLFLNRSIMILEYTVHWVRCKKVIWSIRTITISCLRTSLLIREHLLVWTAASLISNLSLLDHQKYSVEIYRVFELWRISGYESHYYFENTHLANRTVFINFSNFDLYHNQLQYTGCFDLETSWLWISLLFRENASTQGCLLLAIQLLIYSIASRNIQDVLIVKDL
jgi:hypothetical protein